MTQNPKVRSPSEKVLIGLAIYGDIAPALVFRKFSERQIEKMTFVLQGMYDDYLNHAFYHTVHNIVPPAGTNFNNPEILDRLENTKDRIRSIFQKMIDDGIKAEYQCVIDAMKNTNKPHPQGTVAELATRFGVSKSEIRRMKSDGTLDQFITSKESDNA